MFFKKNKPQKKQLLIVKLDQIGDYVLFRNFLESVSNSEKYKNFEITLLGNIDCKDLAEKFDNAFINKFIWLQKRKFVKNKFFRKFFLSKMKKLKFDVLISPLYSRENDWTEPIVAAIAADEKIGSVGDLTNISAAQLDITNYNYTKLIDADNNVKFEFFRNKEFFENLLDEKIDINKTYFNISDYKSNKPYVVIFPGASGKYRRWPAENFAKVAKYISEKYNLEVKICGSVKDKRIARKIIKNSKLKNINNLTGKTKLYDLPELFAGAELIVSNDTSAYHIASAVNSKTICLSNGNTFGRFVPYPPNYSKNIKYAFPDEITNNLDNYDELVNKYKYASRLNINDICYENVQTLIDEMLG